MSDSARNRTAAGMLSIAQQRLIKEQPFHARFVARWEIHADPSVGTMAVTILSGVIHLLYGPAFVVACSLPELTSVLQHEVHHLLFGHVFMDPSRFADPEALLIAQEVTANEFIRGPLPGGPILLQQLPDLPGGEDTETRYRRLARIRSEQQKNSGGHGRNQANLDRNAGDWIEIIQPGSGFSRPGDSDFRPEEENLGPNPRNNMVWPLDNHDLWEDARAGDLLAQIAVYVAVSEALSELSREDLGKIPRGMRGWIHRTSCGRDSRDTIELLPGVKQPRQINWQRALQRFVSSATERRPVFNRPPRRFPHLIGIVPGHMHQTGAQRVMAVIDTSGSITHSVLLAISAELGHMARALDVLVVECDAQIKAVYPFTTPITHVRGRGGTDLRPPLRLQFLKEHQPDVVVYFTDGCGLAPDHAPHVPIVWCITPHGRRPVPWGRVVEMTNRRIRGSEG